MGKSNRRPLWDEKDAPPPASDTAGTGAAAAQQQANPTTTATSDLAAAAASHSSVVEQPGGALTLAQQQQQQPAAQFKQPCTLKGAASALYAGALGYFLGFAPATIKFKGRQWGMIHAQGLSSAKQLALMSGMYTAVHCICQRIRMVEDGWNRGIAGCSTGLVLGWSNGPWGALQSCAGLGLISALIDLGGGVEAAEARAFTQPLLLPTTATTTQASGRAAVLQQQQQEQHAGGASLLAQLPPPAQAMALLLGASPATLGASTPVTFGTSSSNSSEMIQPDCTVATDELSSHYQQQQHQHRSKHMQQPPLPWQPHLEQHQTQQPLASAALLLQPATHAMQQLLAAAPPLMFLGACCHSSSQQPQPAAGVATNGEMDDVEGCLLGQQGVLTAAKTGVNGGAARFGR